MHPLVHHFWGVAESVFVRPRDLCVCERDYVWASVTKERNKRKIERDHMREEIQTYEKGRRKLESNREKRQN